MIKGKCPKCGENKWLTRHSKVGHHRPPFERVCRKCHNDIHGIKEKQKYGRKYQPGTKKFKIKK